MHVFIMLWVSLQRDYDEPKKHCLGLQNNPRSLEPKKLEKNYQDKKNETSKMKVVCEGVRIGGWPPISNWIGAFQLESTYFGTSLYNLNFVI